MRQSGFAKRYRTRAVDAAGSTAHGREVSAIVRINQLIAERLALPCID
jgi:hypothetical protein